MGEDIPVPPWVLGEAPWPDGLASVLYLDNAEDITSIGEVLELWHELAVGPLPLFPSGRGAGLKARLHGMEEAPDGNQRRVRPRRWADGLTEDLFQLTSYWHHTGARPGSCTTCAPTRSGSRAAAISSSRRR
jgi:hypothetical protein